jgi:ferredoxin
MKIKIDQETCISCGACVNICPEVFEFNENGKATVNQKSEEAIEQYGKQIEEAIESCPVNAIKKI